MAHLTEHGLEAIQPDQLVIIEQTDFEDMANQLGELVNRNAAGLDDIMLKKILLAYNVGLYSKNADIVIELTQEEYDAAQNDSMLYEPFEICKGEDIEQFDIPDNAVEYTAQGIKTVVTWVIDFFTRR